MKQIGIDFQGWPINALTLREILEQLGFEEDVQTGKFSIANKELLDAYPLDLEDDGMAYGIRPMFIIEADREVYTNEKYPDIKVFNIFRDTSNEEV